ncbi:hypothetical protein V6M85_07495 [Sulfolobus tengchongensis]|uniref:Transposase n=1 Tax=Sulfolobus tengchongensis TaxID=207809 RepID=A0AAX4L6A4_9CREN
MENARAEELNISATKRILRAGVNEKKRKNIYNVKIQLDIEMYNIYNIKFTIAHKGCWTEQVKYRVKTVKISDYSKNNVKVTVNTPFDILKI